MLIAPLRSLALPDRADMSPVLAPPEEVCPEEIDTSFAEFSETAPPTLFSDVETDRCMLYPPI